MPRTDNGAARTAGLCLGAVAAVWAGLLFAPYLREGLPGILRHFGVIMADPFRISFCKDSLRAVFLCLAAYGLGCGIFLSTHRHTRKGEEHGSARWGNARELDRRYADPDGKSNKILTQHVSIGLDGHKHQRNVNVLVCGGSGSGKTRNYAAPQLIGGSGCSFVVLDPKAELVKATGNYLKENGYVVRVLDLIDMSRSHCYNPFVYLRTDNDIQRLVTNLFRNTQPKNTKSPDPFWDQAAQMLLLALIFYLHYEAPPEEQNFSMVMDMIRAGDVKEDNEEYRSALDILFDRLAMRNEEHIALKYYRSYHSGSGKTLKSIQITLMSRLEKFNLESLAGITRTDELELEKVGERKTAIFAVIPDNDTSFNFLVGLLYTQLFQQLYYRADVVHGGRLPVHVHFLLDEFANVAVIDQFEQVLSTMRSREISVSIIIQNMTQLKALFEKEWESIVGNADEFLYLGGNEASTHEYVSRLLGKETIDTSSTGQSKGRSGSSSVNWQTSGRELLTPDEVRMLDSRYALLFIRGERPVMDLKYDIRKHPNYRYTAEGGAEPYRYGEDLLSIASVRLDPADFTEEELAEYEDRDYLIFTEEELEEMIRKRKEEKEKEYEEKKK